MVFLHSLQQSYFQPHKLHETLPTGFKSILVFEIWLNSKQGTQIFLEISTGVTSPFRKLRDCSQPIAIDQVHEQHTFEIKGVGGMVGLTSDPTALYRWMVTGPEIAGVIEDFENVQQHGEGEQNHHAIMIKQQVFRRNLRKMLLHLSYWRA